MPNYQNGKIYKLWSPEGDDIYIGSTTNSLCRRKASHKCDKKSNSSLLFKKYNDVRIELLECFPCNNKEELTKKEGEYIRNNECINRCIAGRNAKEYYEDNKETFREYYEKNKEKIKEYREKNQEKIKEQRKEYYEKTKERHSIRVICECGMNVNKYNIPRHSRSIRHNSILGGLK